MNRHGEQTKRAPRPAAIVRLLMAFSAGILLGVLGSHLFGQREWSRPLFLLLAPLLLGIAGMLTVRTHHERSMKSGFSTGWLLWLGVWVAVLAWMWPQPHTMINCGSQYGPCESMTVSFVSTGGLVFFLVFLAWGSALVIMGAALMESVMTSAQRRGNKPNAS